ncbi:MAG: hypothetical protein IPM91_15705 [Bacteroidetes bacterium]|nr:hypothetical protein [Bacteroidota bacterium]
MGEYSVVYPYSDHSKGLCFFSDYSASTQLDNFKIQTPSSGVDQWWYLFDLFYDTFHCCPFITGKSIPVLISQKQAEFYFVAETEQAKSVVEVNRIQPEWWSLISEAPGAFGRTLLLPMPRHANNFLMWFSVAENIFILLLMVFMLINMKGVLIKNMSTFVISSFLFGVSIFMLSGLVTPIIGALVRYKVPGLPFIIFPFTIFRIKSG